MKHSNKKLPALQKGKFTSKKKDVAFQNKNQHFSGNKLGSVPPRSTAVDLWSVTWETENYHRWGNMCWDPTVLYLICIYVYIYIHYMYIFIYQIGTVESSESSISLGSWPKKSQEVAQIIYVCSFINWVSPSDRSSSSFAQAGVTLIQLLTGQHLIPGSLQKWMLVIFFWGGCLDVTP